MNISSPKIDLSSQKTWSINYSNYNPLWGNDSQGFNVLSGEQEQLGPSSQEWSYLMATRSAGNPMKDYETTENDLKSSLDDNDSWQKFNTHSANHQESLPDLTRPPAPVVESQPSVVPFWRPWVNPPVHSTSTKVKRRTRLQIQKGSRQPKRKVSPECTTYIKSESSQPWRYSSSSISSDHRNPCTFSCSTNHASSSVNLKSMTKEERYERMKKRNREASKRRRDKKKRKAIILRKLLEVLPNVNMAFRELIQGLEVWNVNWILELLQNGVTWDVIMENL